METYQTNNKGELVRETITYPSDVIPQPNLPVRKPLGTYYSQTDPTPPTNNLSPFNKELSLARPQYNYTVHCRQCNCPSIIHTPFPTVTPINNHAMFCPTHGRIMTASKTDAYDSHACSLGVPKKQVIDLMVQSKNIIRQANIKFTKHRNPTIEQSKYTVKEPKMPDNIDWLTQLVANTPNHGTTNVHISCNACQSLSTITLSNKMAPLGVKYCPHCASTNIIITQSEPSHELAFASLAAHYNIHPWYAESLYTLWATSYTQYPTFAAFMEMLPERLVNESKKM